MIIKIETHNTKKLYINISQAKVKQICGCRILSNFIWTLVHPTVKAKLMTSPPVSCSLLAATLSTFSTPLLFSIIPLPTLLLSLSISVWSRIQVSHVLTRWLISLWGKKDCLVMRKREKRMITLCLFEFLSSRCLSYSCYIHGVHTRLVTV